MKNLNTKDNLIKSVLALGIIFLLARYLPVPDSIYQSLGWLTDTYVYYSNNILLIIFLVLVVPLGIYTYIYRKIYLFIYLSIYLFGNPIFQDLANKYIVAQNENITTYGDLKTNIIGTKLSIKEYDLEGYNKPFRKIEVLIEEEEFLLENVYRALIFKETPITDYSFELGNEGNRNVIRFYGDQWIYSRNY